MKNQEEITIEYQEEKHQAYTKVVTRYAREIENIKAKYNLFAQEIKTEPFSKQTLVGMVIQGEGFFEGFIDKKILEIDIPLRDQYLNHYYTLLQALKREILEAQIGLTFPQTSRQDWQALNRLNGMETP